MVRISQVTGSRIGAVQVASNAENEGRRAHDESRRVDDVPLDVERRAEREIRPDNASRRGRLPVPRRQVLRKRSQERAASFGVNDERRIDVGAADQALRQLVEPEPKAAKSVYCGLPTTWSPKANNEGITIAVRVARRNEPWAGSRVNRAATARYGRAHTLADAAVSSPGLVGLVHQP